MAEPELNNLVRRAVEDTLQRTLPKIAAEVADSICERIPKAGSAGAAESFSSTSLLSAAMESMQERFTQADILTALLESAESFAGRVALFVLRSGSMVVWRARGFAPGDPSGAVFDSSGPLLARVLDQRVPVEANASELDPKLASHMDVFGEASRVALVPLIVRDKVAAVLYADARTPATSGASGRSFDANGLRCLATFAGLWIELVAARKAGGAMESVPKSARAEPAVPSAGRKAAAAAPEEPAAAPAATPLSEPAALSSAAVNSVPPPPSLHAAAPASATSVPGEGNDSSSQPSARAGEAASGPAPAESELHRKARRFARLLVDEIRLYNQAKVEEGRVRGDLYARLKTEIEKSRSAYDRRYGQSPVASADYFGQELVRILANNDPALLGSRDSG